VRFTQPLGLSIKSFLPFCPFALPKILRLCRLPGCAFDALDGPPLSFRSRFVQLASRSSNTLCVPVALLQWRVVLDLVSMRPHVYSHGFPPPLLPFLVASADLTSYAGSARFFFLCHSRCFFPRRLFSQGRLRTVLFSTPGQRLGMRRLEPSGFHGALPFSFRGPAGSNKDAPRVFHSCISPSHRWCWAGEETALQGGILDPPSCNHFSPHIGCKQNPRALFWLLLRHSFLSAYLFSTQPLTSRIFFAAASPARGTGLNSAN